MKNHICSIEDQKFFAYEEMENGVSYVNILHDREEIKIPMNAFRLLVHSWNQKGWSEQWDTLSVTDRCFPSNKEE